MNSSLVLQPRVFPDRIAELGFTADLPADWISHELPPEEPDFSDPTTFVPLAVVTAPHSAIVFAFAARPAHDDGTLHDWAWYHLNHEQLAPRAIGADVVAGVVAMTGEAVTDSELGPMVTRFTFFEDGGRLIHLSLTAPEVLADAVVHAWFGMLRSFRLETPRGSRFEIQEHAGHIPAPIPDPWTNVPREPAPLPEPPQHSPPRKRTFHDFALAGDTASLDPETPINAGLRDRGAGLVPEVCFSSDEQRRATVATGAILAQIDVPYGWHVIDDGRRALVLDPGGKVQISMNLIPREGRGNQAILDEIEAQMCADYPHPKFQRLRVGRIHALAARAIADGDQPLEQFHLLFPFRDQSMVLRARVTATPEEAADACNLAKLILESCAFDCFQQRDEPKLEKSRDDDGPAWWRNAVALETAGQLEEAEQAIRDGCQHIGSAASTAEMYRLRMARLKQAGDAEGALDAFMKASDSIFHYASMATSGGEGAALSLERDRFRAQLVAEYGSDPEKAPA